jgi:hypothetical protein
MSGLADGTVYRSSLQREFPVSIFGPGRKCFVARALANEIHFGVGVKRFLALFGHDIESFFHKTQQTECRPVTPENRAAAHTAQLADTGTIRDLTPELNLVPVRRLEALG